MSGLMIDDSNSAVVYSGQWYSYSDWSTNYQRTVHVSNHLNDRAVLNFQGIGVLVNSGQQGVSSRVRQSYTIDGGSPTVYAYSNVTYQTTSQAYRSPTLPDGQHTLTVTNLDGSDSGLYLDFFLVFTADETTSASSSISSTTTTTSTSSSSTRVSSNSSSIPQSGTTASSTTNGTRFLVASATGSSPSLSSSSSSIPSPSSTTNPRNPSQIPLIVGPIIGAIVICGFVFLLLRRRQKQKDPDSPSTHSAFNDPVRIRFPPVTHLANGQKPSSFAHDSHEPPPYVPDLRPPSHLLTPNRLPAKFRSG